MPSFIIEVKHDRAYTGFETMENFGRVAWNSFAYCIISDTAVLTEGLDAILK